MGEEFKVDIEESKLYDPSSSHAETSKSDILEVSCNNRKMWVYIIITIIVICICFNLLRLGSSGPLPNGTPSYIDSESIIYIIVTVSMLINCYSTFLYNLSANGKYEMNVSNILFGLNLIFTILWFYNFYTKSRYKNAFYMSIALLFTNILTIAWSCYTTSTSIVKYGAVPSLLMSGAICWASYKSSR